MEVDGSSSSAESEVLPESAFLSDESSFYGDDKTKSEYELRCRVFDPTEYWTTEQGALQRIAEQNREAAEAKEARSCHHLNELQNVRETLQNSSVDFAPARHAEVCKESNADADGDPMDVDTKPCQKPESFNPYEGDEMAKQLNEPLEDFLNRLKPSSTPQSLGPWIWIAGPQSTRGPRPDFAGLKQGGHRLLQNFASHRLSVEARHPEKHPAIISRMMNTAKHLLSEDLVKLAREKNVLDGKWMLFPSPAKVDEIWAKVATATHAAQLGTAAKVATMGDDDRSKRSRLICVYTRDFSDTKDVKRVLHKLKEMSLVEDAQGIFYKCDAYTYLDITNGNEYRLRASMYGSKELLKED